MDRARPSAATALDSLKDRLGGLFQFDLLSLCLAVVLLGITTVLAFSTRVHAHPDERHHLNAFDYFEKHWWMPDLNSDELQYDPTGNNRVYNGEIVYFLYGMTARLLDPLFRLNNHFFESNFGVYKYRLLNVTLLACLVFGCFFLRERNSHPLAALRPDLKRNFAIMICLVPQACYIYSYANSDAWGLTLGILLMVQTVRILERPLSNVTLVQQVILGILLGLILTSKTNYLVALLLPSGLLLLYLWKAFRTGGSRPRAILQKIGVVGILAVMIAFPLKIYYPLTQPDYLDSRLRMREQRAFEGFKPSDPSSRGQMLASKGASMLDILTLNREPNKSWLFVSFESLYGVFGFMNVRGPLWVTKLAWSLILLSIAVTYAIEIRGWRQNPSVLKYAYILAPVAILANLLASLYFSWTSSYQAQGRFLFPTLPALGILMLGTSATRPENRVLERVRQAALISLYLTGLYFFSSVLLDPYLYP